MKKIAFILALVMILGSAFWGCDTADATKNTSDDEKNEEISESEEVGSLLFEDLLDTYIV